MQMIILSGRGNTLFMIFFLAKKLLKLLSKISAKKGYVYLSDMSDEDTVRNMDYLSHALRNTRKSGAGVSLAAIRLAFWEAAVVAQRKRKEGGKLFGFEKWLSDHARNIYSALSAISDLSDLPHVDGVPRVVILADFIVRFSGGKVTVDRVRRVLSAFQSVTPLTYREIVALPSALRYRLLFELSLLAERSLHYYAEARLAKKTAPREKHATSDAYLCAYLQLHGEVAAKEAFPERDLGASILGFENILADDEVLADAYIGSLREIPHIEDKGRIVSFAAVNEIFMRSEEYRDMSAPAKAAYLDRCGQLAAALSVRESTLAHAAMQLGERQGLHFGEILFYYPRALARYVKKGVAGPLGDEKRKVQGGYAAAVVTITLIVAVFPAYYLRNLWAYLSVLPLFIASLHPVEYLLKRILSFRVKGRPVAQMDYEHLPERLRTMVVTSRFVANKEDAYAAIMQAETLAAGEGDPEINFVVLVDFPSAKEPWSEQDEALSIYMGQLPRSSRISVLIRKRVAKGDRYVARERKRGAILDLFAAVQSGVFDGFIRYGEAPNGTYAILLDDDSEVIPGSLRAAILSMAHPLNADYDLMTFGGRVNRYSIETHYAARYLRSCTVDAYPFYSDFYSDAFDAALYCGKAIVRIAPYLEKLRDFFPDGRVLSHDLIEGAVLRSSSLGRCVYEDAPTTFLSDSERTARWQRGDVMLLPYALCDRVKDQRGVRVPNPIAPIYKLILFINGFSVLRDAMLWLVFLFSFFSGQVFLTYYAVSCLLFVKVYAMVDSIRTFFTNVRLTHAVRGFIHSVELLADELFLSPYRALSGVYLFVVTCLKMAFRSPSLLEWKPFRTTQGAGGVAGGAELLLPSVLFLSAFALTAGNLWISLYALAVGLYDFALLFSGKPRDSKPLSAALLGAYSEQAKKIYAYFTSLTDDGLPTDNLQFFPYEMRSEMTSPTNLGFALLAEISASILGLTTEEGARERFLSLFDKIAKLPRWKGHLYNWYDVRTFAVMPPRVISTVDSANFVACLLVAAEYFRGKGDLVLSDRIAAYAAEADFSALYRKEDRALAIVLFPDRNRMEGRYDLLASESRLAYYFAIGQGVDPECYFSLGRECDKALGNTLLSWSGTAFEYMLPRLFLRAPNGSLIAEQEYRSGLMQMRDKTEGVFGRSECGYADYDDSNAYRYKAVGCCRLALSEERTDAVAPYASFLYAPLFPFRMMKNINGMREMGLEGEFGFYEAMDFERKEIVRSYMTHHQGMSLAALTNLIADDALVRLFSSSPRVRSIRLLLAEENIYTRQLHKRSCCVGKEKIRRSEVLSSPASSPMALAVGSGSFSAVYDSLGRSRTSYKDLLIGKYRSYLFEQGGLFFEIKEGDEIFSPTRFPYGEQDCVAVFTDRSVRYESPEKGVTMTVAPLEGYDGEIRKVTVRNTGDAPREVTLSVFSDVALAAAEAYDSHPAYSDMFLSARYDEETQTEYLWRKTSDCAVSVAASLSVKGLKELRANCNAYNAIGRGGDARSDYAALIAAGVHPPFGVVLYPCFSFSGKVTVEPHNEASIYTVLLAADSSETLAERNRKIDLAYRSGAIELIGRGEGEEQGDLSLYLRVAWRLVSLRSSPFVLAARYAHREEFAAKGISPERDILYLDLTETFGSSLLLAVAGLSERLTRNGLPHTLVLVYDDIEGAGANGRDRTMKKLSDLGIAAVTVSKEDRDKYRMAAKVVFPLCDDDSPVRCEPDSFLFPEKAPQKPFLFSSGEGGFTEAGYAVSPFGRETLLPYANVVGAGQGGFVVTERGGGFTFGANARENKLTVWTGDALRDPRTEEVTLDIGSRRYLLNGSHAEHRIGSTAYSHVVEGMGVCLSLYPAEKGKCKVFEILFSSDPPEEARISLSLTFALGWRYDDAIFAERTDRGYKLIARSGATCYLYCDTEIDLILPRERSEPFRFRTTKRHERGACRFYLSVEPIDLDRFDLVRSRAEAQGGLFRSGVVVQTGRFALDRLYNRILPYQTLSARLNAKTGFYQCGGAVGFRDQLQDCLAFLLTDPDLVKRHILDAAAHQYEEGDVQHWWHPPQIGVRTRISDDRLWLAYLTARYVEVTGDRLILDLRVPFLRSQTLREGEHSRYEIPEVAGDATLREHIARAIERSLSFGEHDLLKIGSGDWNDGLDRVGVKGRGESVWLSMFACKVIEDVSPFFGDRERMAFFEARERLVRALAPLCRGGRYPLAFADDGAWLGYADTPACTMALNPQTWAVLSGALPLVDAKRALDGAKALVDEQEGIVRLSVPPFDKTSNYGYISAYPKGVRENGGQYTHAVVWHMKALLSAGEKEEAYRILTMLNPIQRATDRDKARTYMGEPYVLAGDIYGYEPYRGRVGWTWYTGSAGWLLYVLTEDFFGIKRRGDRLFVEPQFPSSFMRAEAEVRLLGKRISIRFERGERDELLLEGKKIDFYDLTREEKEVSLIRHFR